MTTAKTTSKKTIKSRIIQAKDSTWSGIKATGRGIATGAKATGRFIKNDSGLHAFVGAVAGVVAATIWGRKG